MTIDLAPDVQEHLTTAPLHPAYPSCTTKLTLSDHVLYNVIQEGIPCLPYAWKKSWKNRSTCWPR